MDTNIDPIEILEHGAITIRGEFLWGSNYTFLAEVSLNGLSITAVYKPSKGERPLWDFPASSLAKREVAAYQVSEILGWNLVPPTVYRKGGPLGVGSLQLFIDHDPEYHFFNFDEADRQRLRPVVLFDLIINNADRKGSHILKATDSHLWLIDHGVCFHVEDKLRTVIWDFIGEQIPEDLCSDISRLSSSLLSSTSTPSDAHACLTPFLSQIEIRALANRAERIAAVGRFPPPDPYRRVFPWPQI